MLPEGFLSINTTRIDARAANWQGKVARFPQRKPRSDDMQAKQILGAILIGVCGTALAGGLGDLAGGGGMGDLGSLASGNAGNAAGVIEYCVKNNYLGGDMASSMKDKLIGKAGGDTSKDAGFADGAKGLVQTSDGKSVDLSSLGGGDAGGLGGVGDMKSKLTKKACGAVLDHASSLL